LLLGAQLFKNGFLRIPDEHEQDIGGIGFIVFAADVVGDDVRDWNHR
jgi:hypothetical protein